MSPGKVEFGSLKLAAETDALYFPGKTPKIILLENYRQIKLASFF
jgi:hypothetical protein